MSRLAALSNRFTDALRHKEAFGVTEAAATGFEHLQGRKYALLTTFRRSGEGVPTPVWFGLDDDGRMYFRTESHVGKVKRIRRDGRVLVAPCTVRGRPRGPAAEGRARVLAPEDADRAERAIQANYGLGRRVYEGAGSMANVDLVYVEITPAERGSADG
jgi:uncharacterized protein